MRAVPLGRFVVLQLGERRRRCSQAGSARRRTRGLGGAVALTLLAALVPGSGYLIAGRRAAGWIVLAGWTVVAGIVLEVATGDRRRLLELALDPTVLRWGALTLAGLLLVWVLVVWTSYRLTRPRERSRAQTVLGNVAVVLVCVVVALPAAWVAQSTLATANFMAKVFDDNLTATAPDDWSEANPFGDRERVNVLLLGSDSTERGFGVRTDSVILLIIDVESGRTVSFSLPRNLERARFPRGSTLAEIYPDGFGNGTAGDANYMLNAVYQNVPRLHPDVLGASADEGADAIKQAVSGTLGVPVEYYVMVDLAGFREVVDAMGGVTVNINDRVAIGGDTDRGIPPDDYLEPGPAQHLDGFHALWFARGRWGSDDYARMERQRCVIDAIIQRADPARLLVRYLDLIAAGEDIVRTDIPRELAPDFAELALRVKDSDYESVVFQRSDAFDSGNPDVDHIRARVAGALSEAPPASRAAPSPGRRSADGSSTATTASTDEQSVGAVDIPAPEDAADACAYRP